jgi:hypothetical protein
MTQAKTTPAKEKTIKVRVLRDFWPKENERVRKGTEVDVSVEEALDGIESGAFERVK